MGFLLRYVTVWCLINAHITNISHIAQTQVSLGWAHPVVSHMLFLGGDKQGGSWVRGLVLTLARIVWGTYLEKNCPSSNGHLVDCGGVKMLARMVWGTYAVKVEVQIGNCLIVD